MPQAAFNLSMSPYLLLQVGDECLLGRLLGGRGQRGEGQREFVAPAHLVVEK